MSVRIVVALLAVAVALVAAKSNWETVQFHALSRHGHRAPNEPYWKLCPNDKYHEKMFDVEFEGVTGVGLEEEFKAGQFLRKKYDAFIGPTYSVSHHLFYAVGEPRTLSSCEAVAQGIFTKHGLKGYNVNRPPLIPIFTNDMRSEYMLKDIPCMKSIGGPLYTKWVNSKGKQIAAEPKTKALLAKVSELCGTPKGAAESDLGGFIKIVVDGLIFVSEYTIPGVSQKQIAPLHGKVDDKMMFALRNLSITFLYGELYTEDIQKTIVAGDYPHHLVLKMTAIAEEHFNKTEGPKTKNVYVYDCHREEMYGMAEFFDFDLLVKGYAPKEVPSGSTFVVELQFDTDAKGVTAKNLQEHYFVSMYLWTPAHGEQSLHVKPCSAAAKKDKRDRTTGGCYLDHFVAAYDERVKRTGTWQKICDAPQTEDETI